MFDPQESEIPAYAGRSFRDPDDGSGAACLVGGERYFELEIETVPDDIGRASYIEELR